MKSVKLHCREICSVYRVKKPSPKDIGSYEAGHKRCSSCEIYIDWAGKHCPCCGHFLRNKPRNSKARIKLNQNGIFKKLQLKLNLSQETIDFSKKLFAGLMEKNCFKQLSLHLVIAVSVFLASRFRGDQISLKKISAVFKIREVVLELCGQMALDEIKLTLVSTN